MVFVKGLQKTDDYDGIDKCSGPMNKVILVKDDNNWTMDPEK